MDDQNNSAALGSSTGFAASPIESLWTMRDVCRFLRVGKNVPTKLIADGELPVMKIGRRYRFDPKAVRAYADRHLVQTPVIPLASRR